MKTRRSPLWQGILILGLLLIAVIIISASVGASSISLVDCFKIIFGNLPFADRWIDMGSVPPEAVTIINQVRLPRVILSAIVGMGLAASGVVYQGIFKNPMADPFVLGVSSGAAVGATLAIVTGIGVYAIGPISMISVSAFLGALLSAAFVFNLARVGNKTPVVTLLLSGVAVNFFLSSIISLIMSLEHNQIERIYAWTMGSVSAASWEKIGITIVPLSIGLGLMCIHVRELNAFALGEDNARSLRHRHGED